MALSIFLFKTFLILVYIGLWPWKRTEETLILHDPSNWVFIKSLVAYCSLIFVVNEAMQSIYKAHIYKADEYIRFTESKFTLKKCTLQASDSNHSSAAEIKNMIAFNTANFCS